MKYLLSILIFSLIQLNVFAFGPCSKEVAERRVLDMCEKISKHGDEIRKMWPNGLLFKNCGDNYIWIQDSKLITIVIHPIKQNLIGKNVSDIVDEDGVPLFVQFDKKARENVSGGWVTYKWTKIGKEKATPKSSFVKLCKLPNGKEWIVGSGIWLEDL